ncbi:hypothetical protein H5410_019879 [Solanum commersonii]|uniref:Uncharacterized protein n=1 Tax=Solanum commersonii TaxID=4109 RepID=A0A9J5ZCI4_SOLCO|nr:hypothetical protein H5410_019879 [Solanum commersonii]
MRQMRPTITYSCIANCKVTSQLWSMFLKLTDNNFTMPEHTADLLSCWIRRGGSKSQKKWWRMIPACIWWTIWKERNGRSYENKTNSIQKVKEKSIVFFYFWCKLQDNVDLFFQTKNNLTAILNKMKNMPGIMSQMPPLPVFLNEELASSLLPSSAQLLALFSLNLL